MIETIKQLVKKLGHGEESSQTDSHHLHLAAAALLVETARADHVLHKSEEAALRTAIKRHLDLSDNECESLLAIAHNEAGQLVSYHPFTQAINKHYSAEEKLDIIKMMWLIALADKTLDKYERHLIFKIAGLIYVTREKIVWARHRACEELGLNPRNLKNNT